MKRTSTQKPVSRHSVAEPEALALRVPTSHDDMEQTAGMLNHELNCHLEDLEVLTILIEDVFEHDSENHLTNVVGFVKRWLGPAAKLVDKMSVDADGLHLALTPPAPGSRARRLLGNVFDQFVEDFNQLPSNKAREAALNAIHDVIRNAGAKSTKAGLAKAGTR